MREITATTTYEPVVRDKTEVISEHLRYMTGNRVTVEPELRCFPSFYWLHKQPYGNRFIAASYRCTTKPLSKLLTGCLNTIITHFRQYCNGIYCRTGVNCFWVIENSQQVLSALDRINYFSLAKHSDSYDFSTLYTSIPHNSLKYALKSLIQEAYKVRDNTYLVVHSNGRVVWSDVPSTKQSLTEDKLISYVDYLIDNIYVSVGNKVYRQCVGIPMGTDCAPLLANLFLFSYEYRYMRGLIKSNILMARKFNNTMRYIDDLLVMNNTSFSDAIQDIYPSELRLKKTTESTPALSYLDILITIEHGKYSTTLYDKRDSFQFDIVNFPNMSSNIPSKPTYGIYISQLVRIGRICSSYETLYPPLGRFVGHVLFSSEPASKPHHRFIHCQLTTWIVTCVESCEQRVEEQLDFVDSLHSTRGVADVEQPEEQLEPVTRHHPMKKGYFCDPRCLPVILQLW